MRKEQEYSERIFFDQFKDLWKDFPKGCLEKKDESPDYILHLQDTGYKLGIEITELICPKNSMKKFPTEENYSLENKILEKAKELFNSESSIPLQLEVCFSHNFTCKQDKIKTLASEICNVAIEYSKSVDLEKECHFRIEKSLLKELTWIAGDYYPGLNDSVWNSVQMSVLPHIENEQIKKLIAAKSTLIPKYREKVDDVCLLIVEGMPPISWFDKFDNWKTGELDTDFKSIFLLRRLENKLYQL